MENQKLNQRQQSYNIIRNAITFGELKPGERLVERDIAETYKIGRTPLREALRQLEIEGYVDVSPNKGAIISSISIRDIEEIYDLIALLEGFAIKNEPKNITPEIKEELLDLHKGLIKEGRQRRYREWLIKNAAFHGYLTKLSNNDNLLSTIENLRKRVFRYRFIAITIPGHIEEYIESHENIMTSLFKGELEQASIEMRNHVLHVKEVLVTFLRNYPNY